MSWKDKPLGGASDFGTGYAQGAMQGMAINNLNRAVDSWQAYAAKLEERLRQSEEGQAKWRAVAVENTAQAIAFGKCFKEEVGQGITEFYGEDQIDQRIDEERESAEHAAENDFSNTTIR